MPEKLPYLSSLELRASQSLLLQFSEKQAQIPSIDRLNLC